MKNYYASHAIIGIIGAFIGGSAVFVYTSMVPAAAAIQPIAEIKVQPTDTVSAAGVLVIDQADLKPGTWFVTFEEGGQSLAVELAFDGQSKCIGKTSAGKCAPDRFAPNRPVEVQGIVSGEALLVRELRFPVPLE